MRKIQRRAFLCTGILVGFLLLFAYFLWNYKTDSKLWFTQRYNRNLFTDDGQLLQGRVLDRNGVLLSYAKDGAREFHDDSLIRLSTLHVVGDALGKIGTGAHSTLTKHLVSYSPLYGANRIPEDALCYLTIDSEANKTALSAMQGRVGTVAVYNYKNGELLCLVSTPTYDPQHIPEDLEVSERYEGAYLNRFFTSTFRPGSVFKTVTLQAVLESIPDATERTYECNGTLTIGEQVISCPKAHGKMSLKTAYALSCNCTFAKLAVELTGPVLLDYVNTAGLTSRYSVCGVSTLPGSFEMATVTEDELAYAGVGLYHNLVNPCGLMIYYGAIANGGTAAIPTYLLRANASDGELLFQPSVAFSERLIKHDTAEVLSQYLQNNIATMYGTDRFPKLAMGAKTGTVENKTAASDCWFAGFLADEEYPYAFVVYLEKAGAGSGAAADVAGAVLKQLTGK